MIIFMYNVIQMHNQIIMLYYLYFEFNSDRENSKIYYIKLIQNYQSNLPVIASTELLGAEPTQPMQPPFAIVNDNAISDSVNGNIKSNLFSQAQLL